MPKWTSAELAINGEVLEDVTLTDISLSSGVQERTRREMERVEKAIRGAIRSGYDGVDINRPGLASGMDAIGIASIEPWNRPPPDGANGYRTERYTWGWFSDDELSEILNADDPLSEFDADD